MLEERWPSMDLVAERIYATLQEEHPEISSELIRPGMRRRISGSSSFAGTAYNADRFLNRFLDYPRHLGQIRDRFDVFHVVDHSYAHLVDSLPSHRTVVTCHDIDAFRSVVDGQPRPLWFRRMQRRVLKGMQRAARVTCDSDATRNDIDSRFMVAPEKIMTIPLGNDPGFTREPEAVAEAAAGRLLGHPGEAGVDILHVGSTVSRKRIDLLLEIFARVRQSLPSARLIRVGGAFTAEQQQQAERLRLGESILVLPFLDRATLAAVYRCADLVVLPSDTEGFGFPLLEAMACGTPVVATDLPVLREAGGDAALYFPAGDVEGWSRGIIDFLPKSRRGSPARPELAARGVAQASRFTWSSTTERFVQLYKEVLGN